MKKALTLIFLAVALSGCAGSVNYSLSQNFQAFRPRTVAVFPVMWGDPSSAGGAENKDVSYLFRTMAVERLQRLNYRVVPLEEVDEKYLKLGSSAFSVKSPAEAAQLLGADSVLYIRINKWGTERLLTYASLGVSAGYELYSAGGERLWQASYSTRESDIRLDTSSMELAVIKAYEPRIQRFTDAVFLTLPPTEPRAAGERYFDWLP